MLIAQCPKNSKNRACFSNQITYHIIRNQNLSNVQNERKEKEAYEKASSLTLHVRIRQKFKAQCLFPQPRGWTLKVMKLYTHKQNLRIQNHFKIRFPKQDPQHSQEANSV